MSRRSPTRAIIILCAALVGTAPVNWGCDAEPAPTAGSSATVSGTTAAPASTAESAAEPALPSFDEAWAASLTALDSLGPTRVIIVETTKGRVSGEGVPPGQSDFGPQTQRAEQLIDIAGGRARLTVNTSDGQIRTTVMQDRERTSTISQRSTHSDIVSVSRYISLQAPDGLPMPLSAGNAVAPTQGYADLFQGDGSGSGAAQRPAGGMVKRLDDGSTSLFLERVTHGVATALTLIMGPDHLPIRIEVFGKGMPDAGDLQGLTIEYRTTIEYDYEPVPAFADSDFVLDIPADAFREGVTYELALDHPRSERADWGQYWLGGRAEEWSLTRAEYAIHGSDPDAGSGLGPGTGPGPGSVAEFGDEAIFLLYKRTGATSPNESVQVTVRPLRGRYFEDSLTFAEQRVASGDWVRREMTLAGRPATVFSGALEGGADDRIESICAYLPDAYVDIQVWAPVDPLRVLEALRPVE